MTTAAPAAMPATAKLAVEYKHLILKNRTDAVTFGDILNERRRPLNEQIAALNARFDEENAELLDQLAEAINTETEYDQKLRQLAIDYYDATGKKKLDADCSVRVNTKLTYDTAKAVEWAEHNAPVMIVKTVDKKAFESLPTVTDLDFVTKAETPSAVIAKEFTDI